jgi:hypothetical protein
VKPSSIPPLIVRQELIPQVTLRRIKRSFGEDGVAVLLRGLPDSRISRVLVGLHDNLTVAVDGAPFVEAPIVLLVVVVALRQEDALARCWKVNFDSREMNVVLKWLEYKGIYPANRGVYILRCPSSSRYLGIDIHTHETHIHFIP